MSTSLIVEVTLGALAFIAITFMGLGVYLRNPKSATNQLFAGLSLFLAAYIVVNFLSLHPPLGMGANQLFWIRMVMVNTSIIAPALFMLVHTFPREIITLKKHWIITLMTLMVASVSASVLPFVFKTIEYPNGVPTPIPGAGMPVFMLDFIGVFILSFIVLIYNYYKAEGREKSQLLYFLVGVIITFSLMGLATNLSVVFLQTPVFVFLGPIFPVIMMAFVAYAIVKHRFLNIQPIIARAVSASLFIIVIAIVYALIAFALARMITGFTVTIPQLLIVVTLTALIALTFQPMSKWIRTMTDRFLFRGGYDSEEVMSVLTRILAVTINLDEMTRRLIEKLRETVHISKAAFLIVDRHRIVDVKGIGYDRGTLLNPSLERIIHDERRLKKSVILLEDITDQKTREVFSQYDIEALVPISGEGGEVAILVIGPHASGAAYSTQDINLLYIFGSEAGLAMQNARYYMDLKFASEAKTRFISVVSHQLRTPISSIRWGLEAARGAKVVEADRQKSLMNAEHAATFLNEQLDAILTALDIYDKKIFLKKGRCLFSEMVQDIIKNLDGFVEQKHVRFELSLSDNADSIACDDQKIKHVMTVLLKNAVLYSPDNGKVHVQTYAEEKDGIEYAVFMVKDDGLGITKEEGEHVFDEFFRSDAARLAAPNGLGLDMFIAQSFVRSHGGRIWFESAGRNKGTTFFVAIPLRGATMNSTVEKHMKKILIVEDERPLAETLAEHLKNEGYNVALAFNGREGLAQLESEKPDLILLDIIMPEVSGVDFLKEAQKKGSAFVKTPVIVLSNLQGDEEQFTKMNLHVDGYFVKANSALKDLSAKIHEVLG